MIGKHCCQAFIGRALAIKVGTHRYKHDCLTLCLCCRMNQLFDERLSYAGIFAEGEDLLKLIDDNHGTTRNGLATD